MRIMSDYYAYELEHRMEESSMKIKIKYINDNLPNIAEIEQGNWIDLRSAETVIMKKGEFTIIPLGVAIELPKGYEAIIAPRSSTFKKYGVIQTNGIGVIDNSYCGDNDEWGFPAYAIRDTIIHFGDRICQFRIQKVQSHIEFMKVEELGNADRKGFGSTGYK